MDTTAVPRITIALLGGEMPPGRGTDRPIGNDMHQRNAAGTPQLAKKGIYIQGFPL